MYIGDVYKYKVSRKSASTFYFEICRCLQTLQQSLETNILKIYTNKCLQNIVGVIVRRAGSLCAIISTYTDPELSGR